ncbi:MAG: hypothetical protein TUN42_00085 [Dehalogenimonas sp.]
MVKVFDAYAIWGLPMIVIDGKVVSWGATRLSKIEAAVEEALQPSDTAGAKSG